MYSTLLFSTLIILVLIFLYIFFQYKLNIKNFLPTKRASKKITKPSVPSETTSTSKNITSSSSIPLVKAT